jgi:hypothetical protein
MLGVKGERKKTVADVRKMKVFCFFCCTWTVNHSGFSMSYKEIPSENVMFELGESVAG